MFEIILKKSFWLIMVGLFFLTMACILFPSESHCTSCPSYHFELSGTIKNELNVPLQKATIDIFFDKNHAFYSAETNANGNYLINIWIGPKISWNNCDYPKKVKILVLKDNYKFFSRDVTFNDFFINAYLKLKPKFFPPIIKLGDVDFILEEEN